MAELRWIDGPVHCEDLVVGRGVVRGYVGPTAKGFRGYIAQLGSEWPPRFSAFADHPTHQSARTWVEAKVTADLK